MRKILLVCICILKYIICFAEGNDNQETFMQEVIMQLTDTKDYNTLGQHKAPARMPKVSYDSQHLYITPHYDIIDAHITIRDETDNIIYDIYTTLIGAGNVIMIPKDVMERKYSLELTFHENYYIGIFL